MKTKIMKTSMMKKMNRIMLLTFMTLVLIGSLAACGTSTNTDEAYKVEIEGTGVVQGVEVTLSDMKHMEAGVEEASYFSLNSYGTRDRTNFKGVWLWYLLQQSVEFKPNASTVTLVAEDGYQVTYSLEEVQREDYLDEENPGATLKMIIAWEQEGEPLSGEEGNPLQLVVGQRETGDVNKPYWVRNISRILVE